jgi:hypothetical protein
MISFNCDLRAGSPDCDRPNLAVEPRPLADFMAAVLARYGISAEAEKTASRLPGLDGPNVVTGGQLQVR